MHGIDPEKEFLRTFKQLTRQRRSWEVWSDFIVMAACALSNPLDKAHYDEREARYLRVINKYRKLDQQLFPTLFAHMVLALEYNSEQDFLGKLYMTLGLQDRDRQQEFTPYSICDVMAGITVENVVKQVQENGYVSINDPCCGAGATLISAIHYAKRQLENDGLNFQNHILVAAQDIDETVALMCYIQLSLLGVAAYIKVGNSLTNPMSAGDAPDDYWFTPMYFSDVWAMRRLVHRMDMLFQTPAPKAGKKPFRLRVKLEEEDCRCSLSQFYEKVAEKAHFTLSDKVSFDPTKIRCTETVQKAIYDFYRMVSMGDDVGIAMLWASSGPKADLEGDGHVVEIEDGFVMEETEEEK